MADDNEKPQIEVNASPLPDQIYSGIRAAVLTLTSFALGRHWIEGDVATVITALLGIVAPIVLAQINARHRSTQLTNIASDQRVPDTVAVVKS